METLRLVALFSVLATVYSKAVNERATINAFVSSDGTRFERASTNAECCSTNSILMTEDGTEYRWPIVSVIDGLFECGGGMKKTFNEWLDFTVEHNKKMAGFRNICFEGWRYTISESAEVTTEMPEDCTYDEYGRFYEAAHNDVMTEVKRYVEEHNCCPSVPAGRYGKTALWVAAQRGNDDILAYLKTVGACADDYDPANYDLDRTDGDAGVDFPE